MRAGALTAELVSRLGAGAVCAVDPLASFVAAVRERLPAGFVTGGEVLQLTIRYRAGMAGAGLHASIGR